MNESNLDDVGQMRSRRGISMKRMTKDEHLRNVPIWERVSVFWHLFDIAMDKMWTWQTHKHSILMMMMKTLKLKMLAMPRAKQSIMDNTPDLCDLVSLTVQV